MAVTPSRQTTAGTLAALLALLLAAPAPGAALRTLAAADPHASPAQPLVALVALLAWALAGWCCAVVVLTTGGHLPGRAGRALAAVARRTAPATVRHAVEVALGLTVAAGVLTSPAAAATVTAAPTTASAAATPPAPSLDWGAAPAQPAPGTPLAAAPGTTAPDQPPAAPCTHARPAGPSAAPATATTVVVRPGDTLWHLAEQHLRAGARGEPTDAEVAAGWPSWWAANREVIGEDPHLLLPGTVLQPPAEAAPQPRP